MKKRICVFLAPGYEEIEALTPVDFFRRAGYDVDLVSTIEDIAVESAHNVILQADTFLEDIRPEDYVLAVIPGGLPGAPNLAANEGVLDFLRAVHGAGDYVAAICAGPLVLEKAGLLQGRRYTCYPGYETNLADTTGYEMLPFLQDENIITGMGPGASAYFALKLLEVVAGEAVAEEIKAETVINEVETWSREYVG